MWISSATFPVQPNLEMQAEDPNSFYKGVVNSVSGIKR